MSQTLIISVFALSFLLLIFLASQAKNIQKTIIKSNSLAVQPIITTVPTVTIIPTPKATLSAQPSILANFYYPHSIEVKNTNELVLQSSDNPQTITNWYKNVILSHNLKTTSFIQTNTNGQILNQLVGAGGNTQIKVEISKEAGQGIVIINVSQ